MSDSDLDNLCDLLSAMLYVKDDEYARDCFWRAMKHLQRVVERRFDDCFRAELVSGGYKGSLED